ncbi:hypothetical protein G9A89_018787 [Geosiphon pyriformis]|nr:hypothetical protein G9A89_018787 [Geosiphon pyriformis]
MPVLLFSGAILDTKLITTMYTDTKVNDQLGCRVDCAVSTKIIMADGATKTPIVNGITVPIKVLVIKATQYQALVAICDHFKITTMPVPLIELEEEKEKPIWEAYQVLWTNNKHNKLPLVSS